MKKPSKYQRKWIEEWVGEDQYINYLLDLLCKLKVIKRKHSSEVSTNIYNRVREWYHNDLDIKRRKESKSKARNYDSKPPRSIKPTRTRS